MNALPYQKVQLKAAKLNPFGSCWTYAVVEIPTVLHEKKIGDLHLFHIIDLMKPVLASQRPTNCRK